MKRLLTLTLLLAGLWLMPSSASAQFNLGGLLKAVTGDSDGPVYLPVEIALVCCHVYYKVSKDLV